MSSQPPSGFIHLVISSQETPFYLEVPTAIVTTLCLSPRKYLRYLGWCVLGVIGALKDEQGNEIALEGELVDQGVYHYVVPDDQDVLAHAVDLEVIKERTHDPSETTGSRDDFRTKLLERDDCCVWTGYSRPIGMHIIPHRRGDEWLRCIIENRPHEENLETLTSINDTRNGVCTTLLHNDLFDTRDVAVLKTPNPILETTDVPKRHQRDIPTHLSYPTESRYTLQWLIIASESDVPFCPNNSDAAFTNQRLPKPADLLLHYNYGAAAVKQWGKNTSVLTNIPRPTVPEPAAKAQASGSKRKRSADLDEQDGWDEDDVMLFFWGNSRVARERHAQKEKERKEYLEQWRGGVTGNPDIE